MRLAWLALLLTACSTGLDTPDAEPCAMHDSLGSCTADERCEASTCPGCGSDRSFQGCFARGHADPYGACPALGCATSSCGAYTDAASCTAAGCFAQTCPGCSTGSDVFVGCFDGGAPPPLHCEPVDCPAGCSVHQTDADCSADPNCYSLFMNGDQCDCAAINCCMTFFQCATGPAQCGTGPSCDNPPLDLACGDGYTTAIANGCELGCIHDSLCADGEG